MPTKINLVEALKKQGVEIEDDQVKVLDELSKSIETSMKEQESSFGKAMEKAIKDQVGELDTDKDGNTINLMQKLSDIAGKIDSFSTQRTQKMDELLKFQLKKQVKENHKELCDAIKNKAPFEITFKDPAMHMTNNSTVSNADGLDFPATDNFLYQNEIVKIRFPENFILDVIPNTAVAKVHPQIIRKEQDTTEGAAALTDEGAVKPLLQYLFIRTSTTRKKVAGRIEWTEEFEMDFEMLFNEIVRLFEEDIIRTWQDEILDQMINNATAYVSSTLDNTLPYPDNGLAVVAIQSQIQQLNYEPNVAIMNPADIVATLFQQNADGDLKLAPYINTTSRTINGMRLFATNKMEQGEVLVGESSLYREWHSDFILRTGQYGDQLIENEYTAIGEVFFLLQIAERDLNGWVHADLDTVKAALQEPEPSE